MRVHELTNEQKTELKQSLLEDVLGRVPSWGDIADVDNIVSDERMVEEYDGICFSDADFFCSCS